jgi:two-component system, NtrC family, sensor kinase
LGKKSVERSMKIAIIGGGTRCRAFLEMLDARRFPRLRAKIVAVADPNDRAVGVVLARQRGIPTTRDYRDIYQIEDLDLVIELTGQEKLLEEFIKRHPAKVRVLEAAISRLFGDLLRHREEYLCRERHVELIESIVDSLFLSIRDRVLIIQPDFKIVDANQAFLRSMGMTKDSVIGKFCHEISHQSTHPCNGECVECPVKESLDKGEVVHAIHEHLDRNQQIQYCEVSAVPLRDREGNIELILEIHHDITDELGKRVEEKTLSLKKDMARLVHEDKMIALGRLVASAVHEINNPLAGINSLARLMHEELETVNLKRASKERFKYYLNLISTESARCSSIVSNLLSFSRQRKVEHHAFQLNDLIENVFHLCKYKMELQQIRWCLNLEDELPRLVGDPDQIKQCLLNLIFNAIEAMPTGGNLTVTTQWDANKKQVLLEVKDNGIGIPDAMLSQIFEPFFSTKSQDKGVGLGLSVVYGIIKEHGGSIYVQSEENKGTSFVVRLPI